ncbi:hypothetical protein KEM56_004848 [Ascosphaera pollenicola]|nr:hypothetical protein KEM56_004848 [Ascosphaera pollenicola]
MSLNAVHEIVATKNAARAKTADVDRSKQRRKRSDTIAPGSREGPPYDYEHDRDWWAREIAKDSERRRRHAQACRNDHSRHRGASRGPGNELERTTTRSLERKQRDLGYSQEWARYRAEAEQAERYDMYRPQPIYKKSRKHKHRYRRSRDDKELETPLSPSLPSLGDGIGAAIAAAAGIAGGIAGVDEFDAQRAQAATDEVEMKPQKPWSILDVKKSREYRKDQQGTNLASLTSLANHFTDMTTTLDTSYSSLFDKLTNLQNAIYAFKDLLDVTTELRSQTNSSITTLKSDAQERIASLNNFESQVTKIDDLQRRMTKSRDKAALLNKRLDTARETITKWQQKEVEWSITFQKRVKLAISIAMGVLSIVIMIIFLRMKWSGSGTGENLQHIVEGPIASISQTGAHIVSSAVSHMADLATEPDRFEPVDICLNSMSGLARDSG